MPGARRSPSSPSTWKADVTRAYLLSSILVAAAAGLAACGSEPVEQWPPVKVYAVRGEVESFPPPDRPRHWISIRHEAIPDFIGILGDPEPMKAMTMRFAVAEAVDVDALDVGDKIAFELEVDWSADDRARLISFEALPAETELDFGG